MKKFTEQQLREYWQLMKKGMRISTTMARYNISQSEAIDLYDQAEKLHNGGLRPHHYKAIQQKLNQMDDKLKRVPHYEPDRPKKIVRPPARYDNMSREDYINKYLNLDI